MSRNKLIGTALALLVLATAAVAASRARHAAATSASVSVMSAPAGASCPFAAGHGVAAEAAGKADCPHDATGKTSCELGSGGTAADCPAKKTEAKAKSDCCKGEGSTP